MPAEYTPRFVRDEQERDRFVDRRWQGIAGYAACLDQRSGDAAFHGDPGCVAADRERAGQPIDADQVEALGERSTLGFVGLDRHGTRLADRVEPFGTREFGGGHGRSPAINRSTLTFATTS